MIDRTHPHVTDHAEGAPGTWRVLKFGGTSVATPEGWRGVARACRATLQSGRRPLVVCSALAGVSDALEELIAGAERGTELAPAIEALARPHRDLAVALGLDLPQLFPEARARLVGALGRRTSGRVPARSRAEILAVGEWWSTRIGAAFLRRESLAVRWIDARDVLRSLDPPPGACAEQHFLDARCSSAFSAGLRSRLDEVEEPVVLTQGFVARDPSGRTVLLGRGGSDTAAALLAARLGAERLEIFTDVPGMFTANPRDLPHARQILALDYDEAEDLAGMGARVLHPRCIEPVRLAGIPLLVRWTHAPELSGTTIGPFVPDAPVGVKAVARRDGLCLLAMERRAGWRPVGFMADVASCFKRHAMSIDLLSTSSTSIHAVLDAGGMAGLERQLPALLEDLSVFCRPRVRRDVASISLVGRGIRSSLERLAPVFGRLGGEDVLMMTQSANDLNISFVLPGERASDLVHRLHDLCFSDAPEGHAFGPTWQTLAAPRASRAGAQAAGDRVRAGSRS